MHRLKVECYIGCVILRDCTCHAVAGGEVVGVEVVEVAVEVLDDVAAGMLEVVRRVVHLGVVVRLR